MSRVAGVAGRERPSPVILKAKRKSSFAENGGTETVPRITEKERLAGELAIEIGAYIITKGPKNSTVEGKGMDLAILKFENGAWILELDMLSPACGGTVPLKPEA